jgi:predicted HTH transcriptional regulator
MKTSKFKSSFRQDVKFKKPNEKSLEKVISISIASFKHSEGVIVFIGVDDDGNVNGLESDYYLLKKINSDGFEQGIMYSQLINTQKIKLLNNI